MKQRASAFARLKTAETLAFAKVSVLAPITNKSFGFAILDDQLIMVEGAFKIVIPTQRTYPHSNIYITSDYNIREEYRQGGKARLDIIHYVHRCFIICHGAVLSAHPTASVPPYGMCGHPDYAF